MMAGGLQAAWVISFFFADKQPHVLCRLQLQETLARQARELAAVVQATEAAAQQKKLPIGNKASRLLLTAEKRSREIGHRAVGTDDVLW
jgi:hypothetical protein